MAAFTQNLLWLSTRIVSEEDCDCLRFIASSVLDINQQHKNPKEILEELEKANLLSENNIHIVYDALTLMKRIKLQSEFLEKIGSQQYTHKSSVISAFTRMLISVRHTLGSYELSNVVYFYKKDKGAGVIKYENRAYAVLQYLVDKLLLTNDVESLNKFAEVLEVATSIKGQSFVKKYLEGNPNVPERAGSESTQDGLSTCTVDFTQEDSDEISKAGNNMNSSAVNSGPTSEATGQDHGENTLPRDRDSTDLGYSLPLLPPVFYLQISEIDATEANRGDNVNSSAVNSEPTSEATGQDHRENRTDHGENALPRDRESTDLGYASPLLPPEIDAAEANRGDNVNSSAVNSEPTSEATGQDHGENTLPRDRESTDLGYASPLLPPEIDATEANRGDNVNSSAVNSEPTSEATGQDHGENTRPRDRESTDLGYASPLLPPEIEAPAEAGRGNNVNSSSVTSEPTSETDAPAEAGRAVVLEADTGVGGGGRKCLLMYWLIACGIVVISITAFTLLNIYPEIKVPLMYWLYACGTVVILTITYILLNVYPYMNSFSKEKKVICALFICLIVSFFIGVIYNVSLSDIIQERHNTQRSSIFACFVIIIIILIALYDFNATLSELESLSDIKKVAVSCIIIIFLLMLFHVISNIERILKPLFDILLVLWK
ncbi:uncharacterized protein LOC117112909 isoform X1 [Anneissia japonica]|uniref:uncharacterized protein LOC117112909 isoform X1 n=1 Tax=Anneissia japonica TaxID=1529436 RepID=UPI001425BA0E|nr:uncharacterized protein LOC117112909 isoform X1 [Anneissia japonica]